LTIINDSKNQVITVPANRASAQKWQASSDDVYRLFLAEVRQLTGAATASLLVAPTGQERNSPLLITEGNIDPIPELQATDSGLPAIAALGLDPKQENGHALQVYQSEVADGCVLRIATGGRMPWLGKQERPPEQERRKDPDAELEPAASAAVWIGLRYGLAPPCPELEQLRDPAVTPADSADWLAHVLIMGAKMVWESFQLARLLRDPISQLPGRAEFQARLGSAFKAALENQRSLGLLLINPDEFGVINQRLDRESGDVALAEVSLMLRDCLRQSDAVFRYGGAVFAVLMPKADELAVDAVARKVLKTLSGAYLGGAVRLTFSIGAAIYDAEEEDQENLDELGLLRRADHALNMAKRNGGGCSVVWSADEADLPAIGRDRLSGIFTADTEKDYRNMLLLWDTIAVISSATEEAGIATDFVDRVQLALKPKYVALIACNDDQDYQVLAASRQGTNNGEPSQKLSSEQKQLLARMQELGRTERMQFRAPEQGSMSPAPFLAYAVPLLVDQRILGCIYLDGPEHSLTLDSSDLIFLNALAGQVAVALDRADLALRWREEKECESRRLREEVQDLRQVVNSARLVYSSPQMESLLETARTVATTDVTVLINGESGTGKEMLARAIHEISDRKETPLVTVDCGTIAHNLIEAELFGYTKGAFTGADKASEGRIVQADGGTIFLDEIGELPLDVQAKLLRFVQEKEIHPVGATSSKQVDVRIIAATNRDLATEAAAGRFREDLYYRLKVVTLTAPPLRERPADIFPLATHFLEKFAVQYEKGVRRFSNEAEELLLSHGWPGNVRELQNSILRAVVLSNAETIGPELLQFESTDDRPVLDIQTMEWIHPARPDLAAPPEPVQVEAEYYDAPTRPEYSDLPVQPEYFDAPAQPEYEELAAAGSLPETNLPADPEPAPEPATDRESWNEPQTQPQTKPQPGAEYERPAAPEVPWQALRRALGEQIDEVLQDRDATPVPLGRWLSEDLLLSADELDGGVATRAANRLGLAETTYRRQLEKARRAGAQGQSSRSDSWRRLQPIIARLAESLKDGTGENVLEGARATLLDAVAERAAGNDNMGSALMGVTVPTYRRWLSAAQRV